MADPEVPPTIALVGKKNSGKTTLLVAVVAELRRRGLRVATVKHGHHDFEIDQPGRDSWRHFHEGGAEATLLVGGDRVVLVQREPSEPDPEELVQRFFAGRGLDLVLVEGYKHGPFPRIEIHRHATGGTPIFDPADEIAAASYLALVTDDPSLTASIPVLALGPAGTDALHVRAVADLLEERLRAGGTDAG